MSPFISRSKDYGLSYSLFEALKDKESKRLKFAECPACKKLNSFRNVSSGNSTILCKSCNAPIPVEKHDDAPWLDNMSEQVSKDLLKEHPDLL
jgi:hypothetical protein